jgi:membrane associated rhomboid family serine protease
MHNYNDYDDYDIPPQRPRQGTQAIWERHAYDLKLKGGIILGLLAFMWLIEIIDWLTPWWPLDWWGIHPWQQQGLYNIFFAPFLHADFNHLIANSFPFAFLGFLIIVRSVREFFLVTLVTIIGGGIGIWLFGGYNPVHLGASILVFGYLGFILAAGVFERKVGTIGRSLAVLLLYYSLLAGVFPSGPGISWQGHLFGLLSGAIFAYFLGKWRTAEEQNARRLSESIYVYHDDARDG